MGDRFSCEVVETDERVELYFSFPGTKKRGGLTIDKADHPEWAWFLRRAKELGALFHQLNYCEEPDGG